MSNEKEKAIEDAIALMSRLHRDVGTYARNAMLFHRRIEIALITGSSLTSGALWSMLAGLAPDVTAWVGAILATAVTALTLYQKTQAPLDIYQRAAGLYREASQILAELRSGELDESAFWHRYKSLQGEMIAIDWISTGREGNPPVPA